MGAPQYNNIVKKESEPKAALNIARNEDRLYNSVVGIINLVGNISSLD